jgi:disulfide bond formation protein DsbB
MISWILKMPLYWAWFVALIGFCFSVFYAEILGNPPCPLCWYQRIALFPLVILLGLAAYRKDYAIVSYAMPIVICGGFIAAFHVLQPFVPFLQKNAVCRLGVSCVHGGLGAIFPAVSLLGFIMIAAFLLFAHRFAKKSVL